MCLALCDLCCSVYRKLERKLRREADGSLRINTRKTAGEQIPPPSTALLLPRAEWRNGRHDGRIGFTLEKARTGLWPKLRTPRSTSGDLAFLTVLDGGGWRI